MIAWAEWEALANRIAGFVEWAEPPPERSNEERYAIMHDGAIAWARVSPNPEVPIRLSGGRFYDTGDPKRITREGGDPVVPHGGGDRQGARQRVVRAVKVGKRAAAANAYLDGVLAPPAGAGASVGKRSGDPGAVASLRRRARERGAAPAGKRIGIPRHLVEAIAARLARRAE